MYVTPKVVVAKTTDAMQNKKSKKETNRPLFNHTIHSYPRHDIPYPSPLSYIPDPSSLNKPSPPRRRPVGWRRRWRGTAFPRTPALPPPALLEPPPLPLILANLHILCPAAAAAGIDQPRALFICLTLSLPLRPPPPLLLLRLLRLLLRLLLLRLLLLLSRLGILLLLLMRLRTRGATPRVISLSNAMPILRVLIILVPVHARIRAIVRVGVIIIMR